MVETTILGAIVGTVIALRSLYKKLNKSRVENPDNEVQLAAAKGLARMLTHNVHKRPENVKRVQNIVEQNIDRLDERKDHKIAFVLRNGLDAVKNVNYDEA